MEHESAGVFPDRNFKIWDFSVSHQQMVVRSPGPSDRGPHIDLHVRGVEYVRLPTVMSGLRIDRPSTTEILEVQTTLVGRTRGVESIWVHESSGQRHIVVAASLDVSETEFPMMSTALVRPSS